MALIRDFAVQFAQMLLNGGVWKDKRILSALTVRRLTTPHPIPLGDGDLGELAAGGAVQLHVAARHRGVELGWGDGTGRHLELADHVELRHLRDARADAAAGIAGAAEREQHMVADAGSDRGDGALDGGDRAGPAHRRGGGEAQVGDAEIGDEVLGDRAGGVGDDAVDVARAQSGVGDGVQRGFQLQ